MPRPSLLPHILLLGAVLGFVGHAAYTSQGIVVDDAYIAFRYASNLAHGVGLTYNPGGERVEGYTCFSWVLLGALLERVGVPAAVALPLLGILAGAATLVVVARSIRALRVAAGEPPPAWAGLPSALFLAVTPGFAYYAGSGLETPLFGLCVALTVGAALEGRPRRASVFAVAALLTRPEGAAIGAMALAVGLARGGTAQRRPWIVAGASFVAAGAAYAAFKLVTFGALAPNTLLAKPPDRSGLAAYLGYGLLDVAPLLVTTVVIATRRRDAAARWALAIAAGCLAIVVGEGTDWMPAHRFLLPMFVAVAFALDAPVRAIERAAGRWRWVHAGVAVAGAGFYVFWSAYDTRDLHELSDRVAHYEPFRDSMVRRMWKDGVRSIGTLDIGRLTHVEPGLRILDLGGLTDRDVARTSGDWRSKSPSEELLEKKRPDAFLFTGKSLPVPDAEGRPSGIRFHYPVEERVAASSWFRSRYRLREALPIRADYVLLRYELVPVRR